MINETQSAEPTIEVLTTPATEAVDLKKKVELIPYYLHVKQSEVQARMGNMALEACHILQKSLHTHSPRSPVFEEVREIMQSAPILMKDFMQLEEAIDIARKEVNRTLYGEAEPNAASEATSTMEGVNESAQSSDSTERALA